MCEAVDPITGEVHVFGSNADADAFFADHPGWLRIDSCEHMPTYAQAAELDAALRHLSTPPPTTGAFGDLRVMLWQVRHGGACPDIPLVASLVAAIENHLGSGEPFVYSAPCDVTTMPVGALALAVLFHLTPAGQYETSRSKKLHDSEKPQLAIAAALARYFNFIHTAPTHRDAGQGSDASHCWALGGALLEVMGVHQAGVRTDGSPNMYEASRVCLRIEFKAFTQEGKAARFHMKPSVGEALAGLEDGGAVLIVTVIDKDGTLSHNAALPGPLRGSLTAAERAFSDLTLAAVKRVQSRESASSVDPFVWTGLSDRAAGALVANLTGRLTLNSASERMAAGAPGATPALFSKALKENPALWGVLKDFCLGGAAEAAEELCAGACGDAVTSDARDAALRLAQLTAIQGARLASRVEINTCTNPSWAANMASGRLIARLVESSPGYAVEWPDKRTDRAAIIITGPGGVGKFDLRFNKEKRPGDWLVFRKGVEVAPGVHHAYRPGTIDGQFTVIERHDGRQLISFTTEAQMQDLGLMRMHQVPYQVDTRIEDSRAAFQVYNFTVNPNTLPDLMAHVLSMGAAARAVPGGEALPERLRSTLSIPIQFQLPESEKPPLRPRMKPGRAPLRELDAAEKAARARVNTAAWKADRKNGAAADRLEMVKVNYKDLRARWRSGDAALQDALRREVEAGMERRRLARKQAGKRERGVELRMVARKWLGTDKLFVEKSTGKPTTRLPEQVQELVNKLITTWEKVIM